MTARRSRAIRPSTRSAWELHLVAELDAVRHLVAVERPCMVPARLLIEISGGWRGHPTTVFSANRSTLALSVEPRLRFSPVL
jgi:hypothetical protein